MYGQVRMYWWLFSQFKSFMNLKKNIRLFQWWEENLKFTQHMQKKPMDDEVLM